VTETPATTTQRPGAAASARQIALLGNPNTGKTSLFNRLCGLRAHVANYPGITADARRGHAKISGEKVQFIDLPGTYSLELELPESRLCRDWISGKLGEPAPDLVITVLDASNLIRNLPLLAEARRAGLPIVVALTMLDLAKQRGHTVDPKLLSEELGVPVIAVNPRRGKGVPELLQQLGEVTTSGSDQLGKEIESTENWAATVTDRVTTKSKNTSDQRTRRLDRLFTHPVTGVFTFLLTMGMLFWLIFELAGTPMGWIEQIFGSLGSLLTQILPEGLVRDLLVEGVVGGIAGTVVFLPQICLLFFLITLLEDTGYLARAAFVANRLLRPFGLPGQAFVPLLSSHACAIPGIMCSRLIPDRQDRLATILVAPFLSCSARLPVYTLLIAFLFADRPELAGVAFAGCYLLGGLAALVTALIFRKTLLRGRSRPLVLELPPYQRPSFRNAVRVAFDRGVTFLVKAGTVILLISVVLWWLSAFPRVDESSAVVDLRSEATSVESVDPDRAAELTIAANRLADREALSASFSGRLGHLVEPVFAPIGADWQLSIAILSSFAAREVFVSALLVTLGGDPEAEGSLVLDTIRQVQRDDGTALLTFASAFSLLVFYVLAMQCLPTLAVTRREAGGWRWAMLQFFYMSIVAWVLAAITYRIVGGMTGTGG